MCSHSRPIGPVSLELWPRLALAHYALSNGIDLAPAPVATAADSSTDAANTDAGGEDVVIAFRLSFCLIQLYLHS